MSGRSEQGDSAEETWEIDGISEAARKAAERAAADSSLTLGIWLTETVLRATQEGVGGGTSAQAVPKSGSDAKPDLKNRENQPFGRNECGIITTDPRSGRITRN